MSWLRQNPVRAFTLFAGLLFAFDGYAAREHLVSHGTMAWLGLVELLVTVALGFFGVHSTVTPLANPKAADGTPLVPEGSK